VTTFTAGQVIELADPIRPTARCCPACLYARSTSICRCQRCGGSSHGVGLIASYMGLPAAALVGCTVQITLTRPQPGLSPMTREKLPSSRASAPRCSRCKARGPLTATSLGPRCRRCLQVLPLVCAERH
jgi:hypothetical protein